eukprot:7048749-Prymnesium_polylepis.3
MAASHGQLGSSHTEGTDRSIDRGAYKHVAERQAEVHQAADAHKGAGRRDPCRCDRQGLGLDAQEACGAEALVPGSTLLDPIVWCEHCPDYAEKAQARLP